MFTLGSQHWQRAGMFGEGSTLEVLLSSSWGGSGGGGTLWGPGGLVTGPALKYPGQGLPERSLTRAASLEAPPLCSQPLLPTMPPSGCVHPRSAADQARECSFLALKNHQIQ